MTEQDAPVSNINSLSKPLSFRVSPDGEVEDNVAKSGISRFVDVRVRRLY